ncbi:hypothetical protein DW728_10080 [Streptococcus parasanguinis]|nr:hypothetical protein DW728_10080 [Streptococcus parasanguinis]
MEEMKEWVRDHKKILKEAASALLAFVVGACLVFMIHTVKTLPKDRLLSLSQMHEDSQQFVASSSKAPTLEDLLLLELARGEGKTQKNWVTLSAFVKKFGKAASFTQEDTSFGAQVQLGYGSPVKGLYPYTIEFQKQGDAFYVSSIQGFSPKSAHYQSKKNLKLADFVGYKPLDGKKEKGTSVEEVLNKSGLPNSLSLTSTKDEQVLALSYQVTDGLVSLTFERDQSGQYRLTKKG